MSKQKKFILQESEIPTQWYNIQADMVNKPMPPLNPATHQPLKAEDLFPIFAEECSRQELDQTTFPRKCRTSIVFTAQHHSFVPTNWRRRWTLRHISISRTRALTRWVLTR